MGSGKTSLGKKLAKRLNLQFFDTDKYIEQMEGMTIETIFKEHGEEVFRMKEKMVIDELMNSDNLLLSTGGGLPCYNNLMAQLNELGTTIYLKRPAKELANRIINSKKKRPITDGKTPEELILLIEQMLQSRSQHYEQAHIIADRTIQDVTTLEMLVKAYLGKK